jgi:soluble lytic murein transglycosylase-like protein
MKRSLANLMIVMMSFPGFALPKQAWFESPKPVVQEKSPYENLAFKQAFFDAARIYGKAGCGDIQLAEMTAKNSLRTGVPANVVASIVAVESSCNPLAISNKGAVGLTQVNVKVQAEKFAQFRAINLFNPEDSMRVGTDIMSDMIHQYGLHGGVSHYNGSGPDADAYAVKVLMLAGK